MSEGESDSLVSARRFQRVKIRQSRFGAMQLCSDLSDYPRAGVGYVAFVKQAQLVKAVELEYEL